MDFNKIKNVLSGSESEAMRAYKEARSKLKLAKKELANAKAKLKMEKLAKRIRKF